MLLNQEIIENQRTLLAPHRRRLSYRLRQKARLGDYARPNVVLDIEEAQAAIQNIKVTLRTISLSVDDFLKIQPK